MNAKGPLNINIGTKLQSHYNIQRDSKINVLQSLHQLERA